MPTLDTTNKRISEYVVTRDTNFLKNTSIKRVLVKNTPNVSIDCLGIPVIVDGSGAWKFFENTDDIAAVTGTGGIGAAKVGIIVGSNEGYGRNQELTTFTAAGAEVHVLFGVLGNPIVKAANLDWTASGSVTSADAGEKAEFIAQLEAQGVANQAVAAVIDPTYVP